MYPKRTEFVASCLAITCVYYILLDIRDIQSCQIGQGKDVAITTPAQSTFCTLSVIKQSRDYLVAWTQFGISLSWGSDQRRIIWFLFGFRLLGNVFSTVPGMYYLELRHQSLAQHIDLLFSRSCRHLHHHPMHPVEREFRLQHDQLLHYCPSSSATPLQHDSKLPRPLSPPYIACLHVPFKPMTVQ